MTSIAQTAVRAMSKWMSMFEYLLTLMPPAQAAALRKAARKGYDLDMVFHPSPEVAGAILKYREACRIHVPRILEELASGTLLARGLATDAALDAAPALLRVEWWQGVVEPQVFSSTATIDRRRVIRIEVCNRQDYKADSDRAPNEPNETRSIVIGQEDQEIVIDGFRKYVPEQPFLLLVMLADAVINGRKFVTARQIEHEFGRAAGDLARELRDALVGGVQEHQHFRSLIETYRSPTRYGLTFKPDEISLHR